MLITLLIFLPMTSCENITLEENLYLKSHCGDHFLNQSVEDYSRRLERSAGGKRAMKNEFPWIVGFYLKKAIFYPPYFPIFVRGCSGVQVSMRHILTAAHCVVLNSPYIEKLCKNTSQISSGNKYTVQETSLFSVFVGSGCTNPELCWKNRTNYSVVKIKVHEDYNPCLLSNDLAIMEVYPNISSQHGSPVCMPKKKETLQPKLTAVGFGIDPTHPQKKFETLSDLKSVELATIGGCVAKTIAMGDTRNYICSGDDGGPLVQAFGESNFTVEGIAIASQPLCRPTPTTFIKRSLFSDVPEYLGWTCESSAKTSLFSDVREYLEWICENSGVCPVPEGKSRNWIKKVWPPLCKKT